MNREIYIFGFFLLEKKRFFHHLHVGLFFNNKSNLFFFIFIYINIYNFFIIKTFILYRNLYIFKLYILKNI